MLLIAHRGNINGSDRIQENTESYLVRALNRGYHIEVDVWIVAGQPWLGHDFPDHESTFEFLESDPRIIVHAKNISALTECLKRKIHCFSHDQDPATLTSRGIPWLYPTAENLKGCIMVMPEMLGSIDWVEGIIDIQPYGVCSDFVEVIEDTMILRDELFSRV